MQRRGFLKYMAGIGGLTLLGGRRKANAYEHFQGHPDRLGVLVDTTLCIGCRRCEWACKEQNRLPNLPLKAYEDQSVFEQKRRMEADSFTVVNRYEHPEDPGRFIYVKRQCMHCNEPACASACLVGAFTKTGKGAVVYNSRICIGCRYCMISCPFDVPAYEYGDAFTPEVTKCTFCFDKISNEGGVPACVVSCPTEAMTFGRRRDLLALAYRKINDNPQQYVHQIYGEEEVGGTSWMYLSAVPFDQIGFRTDLGTTPIPRLGRGYLSMTAMVVLTWPLLCMGFYSFSKRRERVSGKMGQAAKQDGGQ